MHKSFKWNIKISQDITRYHKITQLQFITRAHLHNRELFSWLHHSNVSFIQLPESESENIKDSFQEKVNQWTCRFAALKNSAVRSPPNWHQFTNSWIETRLMSSPETFWSDWFQAPKLFGEVDFKFPKLFGKVDFKPDNFLVRLILTPKTFWWSWCQALKLFGEVDFKPQNILVRLVSSTKTFWWSWF